MAVRAVLVDLDETLYEPGSALIRTVDARITAFIALHTGVPWDRADRLRTDLWRRFGTTARGLNFLYDLDERLLNAFAVDSVDPSGHVAADPALARALEQVTAPCYVFTNAPRRYAERVLEVLGVREAFAGIFSIEFAYFHPKPARLFYQRVVAALGLHPRDMVLVEDNRRNLAPAMALGMTCIYVGAGDAPSGALRANSFREIPRLLASLESAEGRP